MVTIHCQLIAEERDALGYITYVFKNLEDAPFGHTYSMVTRFPNWQHRDLEIGEKGYLTYNEVIAGKDKWYCPETGQMIPYNYTNIYFIRFIKEQDNYKKDILL